MINLKFIYPAVISIFAAGCASMFGPAYNPVTNNINFYSGHVHDGIYTNTIGKAANAPTFSIAIPQAADPDAYAFIQLSDQRNSMDTEVSFGPALPYDYSIYTASVVSRMEPQYQNMTVDQLKTAVISQDEQQTENANREFNLQKIYQTDITFQNQPARYVVYTLDNQLVPAGATTSTSPAIYAALLIIYPQYFALLTMNAQNQGDNAITDENRSLVINMTWPALVNYYDSFSINS